MDHSPPPSPGPAELYVDEVEEDEEEKQQQREEGDNGSGGGKPALVLHETADLAKVRGLLQDKRVMPGYRRYLLALYTSVNEKGRLEVAYRLPRGVQAPRKSKKCPEAARPGCRLYAEHGLQSAPRELRRLVLSGTLELDIRNSVPFFLHYLASELRSSPAEDLAPLREFVTDRAGFLGRVKESLRVADDAFAKDALLRLVHGGLLVRLPGASTDVKMDTFPILSDLQCSVRLAVQGLVRYFPKLWAWCEKTKGQTESPDGRVKFYSLRGRFVHFLTTRFENEVMMRVIDYFGKDSVSTLVHDAVFVRAAEIDVAKLNQHISDSGALSGVERPRPDSKTIVVDGERVPVPMLSPPSDLQWRVTPVQENEGDREAIYLRDLPDGDLARLTGFKHTFGYFQEEDLYLKTFPDGRQERVMHRVSFERARYAVINGHTGMGKTHCGFAAVRELLEQNSSAKVVWVVGRTSQAQNSDKRLTDYLAGHGISAGVIMYENATRREIYEARIIMIQYESVWKLMSPSAQDKGRAEFHLYEMVVVDEAMLIFNQSISTETNGDNLRQNDVIFRALCSMAQRVLILDKDCDKSPHLRDWLLCDGGGVARREGRASLEEAQNDIRFHYYRYVPPHLRRGLEVISEFDVWLGEIITGLNLGRKMLVACHTQRAAGALYDTLQKLFPALASVRPCAPGTGGTVRTTVSRDPKQRTQQEKEIYERENRARATWQDGNSIKLLDGQTAKSTSRFLMSTINDFFKEDGQGTPRLLIFTSKMCVAVDIQTPVDRVFLHCAYEKEISRLGPPARILSQMLMRARRVRDTTICAYFGEGGITAPRCFESRQKTAPLPWEHCEIFKQYEDNYSAKEARMKALHRVKGVLTPWCVIDRGYDWVRVEDQAGVSKLVEVPSSLKLRLLASLAEQRRCRGPAMWEWLIQDFDVVVPPIMTDEQRRQQADDKARRKAEEEEAKARREQELTADGKKLAPPPPLCPRGIVIRDVIEWRSLTVESARKRANFLLNSRGPNDHEKAEYCLLNTFARYPGIFAVLKEAAAKYEKKRGELRQQNELAWLQHEWVKEMKAFYQQCKDRVDILDQLALVKGDVRLAQQLDLADRQIAALCKSHLGLYQAVNGLAEVFGVKSAQDLLHDNKAVYSTKLLESGLVRKLAEGAVLAGPKIPFKRREFATNKAALKYLLGCVGYENVSTGKNARSQKDGDRESHRLFTIQPIASVHAVQRYHDEFYREDAHKVLMKKKKHREEEQQSGSNKRQKLVTADADV